MNRLSLLAALGAWSCFAASARADQLTVVDVTYDHAAETTHDSHLIVDASPATPPNLRSPIDYASGTAYVRLEVFTKPSDVPTRFQVCFNAQPTYACTHQAPPYTTTGVYTWATPFDEMWQGELVDWSRGLGDTLSLILKDTMNGKPAPENVGPEIAALYMPTRIRVTVTLVSPGDSYVPPGTTPDAGVADAGVELDAGRAEDAGTPGDAGASVAHDAGSPDGRPRDASVRDAGPGDEARDAGTDEPEPTRDASAAAPAPTGGCSAAIGASGGAWIAAPLLLVIPWAARRRRRRA